MQKKHVFAKKVYISVLTTTLVVLTMMATTFAWVGVLSNSTFNTFSINLQDSSKINEYEVLLSLTGEEGSFTNNLDSTQLKKMILLNWGYDESDLDSNSKIEQIFSSLEYDPVTTLPVVKDGKMTKFGEFYDAFNEVCTHYAKFDLYVIVNKVYDAGSNISDFSLDMYLNPDIFTGTQKTRRLVNVYTYPSNWDNPLSREYEISDNIEPILANTTIKNTKVDSSCAARLGFEKYEVVDKFHPEQYSSLDSPKSAIIYQNSLDYPAYDKSTGLYTFGNILEDDFNLATWYFNSYESNFFHGDYHGTTLSNEMYNIRGVESETKDTLINLETNHLIDSSNEYEKITTDKMMKMTCYFWFEGWDADCYNVLVKAPVAVNLDFRMNNEDFMNKS